MLSMTTHHFPIIYIDDETDEVPETFLDDADCAYCSDRITRNRGEDWTNAAGETTCAMAPNMIVNRNGSRYCQDCGFLVILFDDDIHYCREAWHRIVDSGRVAPTDDVWTLYYRDEDDEIHSPVMGWMDCIYRLDGTDTDGTKFYRCVVHDSLTAGHEVSCEGASYAHENENAPEEWIARGPSLCDVKGCEEPEHDCHSAALYLCSGHMDLFTSYYHDTDWTDEETMIDDWIQSVGGLGD